MALALIRQLDDLRDRAARMASLVQDVVELACDALAQRDAGIARRVIAADLKIDEEEVLIEKQAIDLLARHQPAAGDLRQVMSIIKANADFERIADAAVNIAQALPPLIADSFCAPREVKTMADAVIDLLRDTIAAFNRTDMELADRIRRSDDLIDALYHQIVQDMLHVLEMDGQQANCDVNVIMIAKNLERMGDHCVNIAEDILYIRTGTIVRHTRAM